MILRTPDTSSGPKLSVRLMNPAIFPNTESPAVPVLRKSTRNFVGASVTCSSESDGSSTASTFTRKTAPFGDRSTSYVGDSAWKLPSSAALDRHPAPLRLRGSSPPCLKYIFKSSIVTVAARRFFTAESEIGGLGPCQDLLPHGILQKSHEGGR
ncbi:MAG: hypothetical protein BWY99_02453 [Synergistetes bacterium ADurb.BinA166]|nr:MAG: hypothetical protein BWY99_02453 [Synergistetes bacterium ADurb.BinA166]